MGRGGRALRVCIALLAAASCARASAAAAAEADADDVAAAADPTASAPAMPTDEVPLVALTPANFDSTIQHHEMVLVAL